MVQSKLEKRLLRRVSSHKDIAGAQNELAVFVFLDPGRASVEHALSQKKLVLKLLVFEIGVGLTMSDMLVIITELERDPWLHKFINSNLIQIGERGLHLQAQNINVSNVFQLSKRLKDNLALVEDPKG